MSEWIECKLGYIAEITSSKRIYYSDYLKKGVPFYRSKEIIDLYNNRKINTDLFISEEKYEDIKLKFGVPQKDDILLTSVGTLGIPYLVAENKFYFKDGNLTWFKILDKNKVLPKYLFLWLKSKIGQDKLNEVTIGSTQPALTIVGLKSVEILLPPLPEQKAIASVLSSLDDKIDLLHRQNKTLEAMAETLFRQWFVEPVRRGGEANEDWEEKLLGDLIDIGSGKGLKKEQFIENGIYPVLGANGEIGKTDNWLFEGELIFTGRVGTLGNIFIINKNEKVWLSDNTLVINPKNYFYFIYFTLKNAKLEEYNVGSTQPLIRQSDIKELELALPETVYFNRFEKIAKIIFTKIQINNNQIKTLESLRDTLLPKLMSGQIRVKI